MPKSRWRRTLSFMTDDKKYSRFGRYLILDHLVDGGMAQINRARFLGEQADKVVAIKMVRSQFSQDPEFKKMFMDEIKVTFDLIHPNIVQTYDYGIHNDQLFVAMEYCDGRNLKQYLDKLTEKKFVFPVEISVYIITQVCQGLHYAHTKSDKLTGKTSNIIHRDISPHNLMLTFDGAVKVIDFGIAKAETNSESTQAGTIKGKLSYLAPEYLEGIELDPRYDEFAVGITLWEMLCCRKLFTAANDLAVLKKIQACKIPAPSSINPNVPKELDEIVLTALSKDREKRYTDMEQFNRSLVKFLYSNFPDFNANDLSYFAKELFKEEIEEDRQKLMEFGRIDLKPYLDDLKNERTADKDESNQSVLRDSENISRKEVKLFDFGFEEESSGTRRMSLKDKFKSKSKEKKDVGEDQEEAEKKVLPSTKDITSNIDLNEDSGIALDEIAPKKPAHKKVVKANGRKKKTHANKKKAGKVNSKSKKKTKKIISQSKSPLRRIIVLGAIAASLAVVFYEDLPVQVREAVSPILSQAGINLVPAGPKKNLRTPSSKKIITKKKNMQSTKILIENFDFVKHQAFLNNKKLSLDASGIISRSLNKDKNYYLRIEVRDQEPFIFKIDSSNIKPSINITVPKTNPMIVGYLNTSRDCINGELRFNLFTEPRVEQLPLKKNIGFPISLSSDGNPIATTYNVEVLEKDGTVPRRLAVTFTEEDVVLDFCAIYFGN